MADAFVGHAARILAPAMFGSSWADSTEEERERALDAAAALVPLIAPSILDVDMAVSETASPIRREVALGLARTRAALAVHDHAEAGLTMMHTATRVPELLTEFARAERVLASVQDYAHELEHTGGAAPVVDRLRWLLRGGR